MVLDLIANYPFVSTANSIQCLRGILHKLGGAMLACKFLVEVRCGSGIYGGQRSGLGGASQGGGEGEVGAAAVPWSQFTKVGERASRSGSRGRSARSWGG